MASDLRVTTLSALLFLVCYHSNTSIGVSAQCNDYSVVGLRDGMYSESCICDVQVSPIPGCTNPPSQSELDQMEDMQKAVKNISSRADVLKVAVEKTNEEMAVTQDDIDDMTTKLERIESGDLKVNKPEFDLILEEIEKLDQVLVLLEADRANNLETVTQLETELEAIEKQLLELKKTQDVEVLLEQIDQLEEELAQCKASVPTTEPPGSGDDDLFVPWDDIGTQDSCAHTFSLSSPYTVRTSSTNGAWMRDPLFEPEKIWHYGYATSCSSSSTYSYIYRYPSYESYEQEMSIEAETFKLTTSSYGLNGPGLAAYNGSIYYVYYDSKNMYRYDVSSGYNLLYKTLSNAKKSGNNCEYSDKKCSAIDFAVDETGLWVIYATSSTNLVVSRLDPLTLNTLQTWTLNFAKKNFRNCFMICARLYCTDYSKINLKFDTVTGDITNPDIKILSRYGGLYTLDYNPRDQKLYGWDNGNMVLYDITFKNNQG